MKRIKVYTDGACSGNPGPGGWAVVFGEQEECKKYSGGEADTTNNRMELMAVLQTLRIIINRKNKDIRYEIYSDSAYVVNAIKDGWLKRWKSNNWLTKKGDKVKNQDLWERVVKSFAEIKKLNLNIELIKIKGHAGNTMNELCDKIAKEEAAQVSMTEGEK